MKHNITGALKRSAEGLGVFLVGFAIGTGVDALFHLIYSRADPKEERWAILFVVVLVQLYIIILAVQVVSPLQFGSSFAFGLLSSQIFFIYAVEKRISGLLYDRRAPILCGYQTKAQAEKCAGGSCDPYQCGPKDEPCFCMYREDDKKMYYDCGTSVPPDCPEGSNCIYECREG